ncbi:hypothetical protein KJ765_04805 [Candidatus Micrarchaeota archaeon]|nr:hypothetical protein [Candidatus Micrarchaeota archaeon]
MRKAFFSFAVIALVSIALFFFAGMAFSAKDYRDTAVYGLEARKIQQRVTDAENFTSAIIDDMMADSAYFVYSCNVGPGSTGTEFCTEFTSQARQDYLTTIANLSTEGIYFQNLSTFTAGCETLVTAHPYNFTSRAYITMNYFVNSTNGNYSGQFHFNKQAQMNMSAHPHDSSINRIEVLINDTSYGKPFTWFANCT